MEDLLIDDSWSVSDTDGAYSGDSFNNTVLTILLVEAVVLALLLAITFTVEQLLVAAEAFFLFAGWSAIRVAGLSRRQESEILEKMRVWAAVAFGVCGGLLVAHLMLTTEAGQQLTLWVTAQHFRVIASLFGTVLALSLLEFAWHKIIGSLGR